MSVILDPQTEQRIQQETDRRHYRGAADLINRALDVLAAVEPWTRDEKSAFSLAPEMRSQRKGSDDKKRRQPHTNRPA